MTDVVTRAIEAARREGVGDVFRRSVASLCKRAYYRTAGDSARIYRDAARNFFRDEGVNICRDPHVRRQYDPSRRNVLVVTESPAVVENEGWLEESMEFAAEISFGDFYSLDNYYPPRGLYAGRDSWVQLRHDERYESKSGLLSMIYSDKTELAGHELRHEAHELLSDRVDAYGSGAGEFIADKRDAVAPYRFQVVIENGLYDDYVSEKFYDPLKTMTVPIYRGGRRAVERLGFDTDGILFFEDLSELSEIAETLSPALYEEMHPHVEANRRRLVEIRNRSRNQLFLSLVRPGFHTTQAGEAVVHDLVPELLDEQ